MGKNAEHLESEGPEGSSPAVEKYCLLQEDDPNKEDPTMSGAIFKITFLYHSLETSLHLVCHENTKN